MSFHFKLLGAQYFKKLQRNIVEKKNWKSIGGRVFNRKKSVRRKKYHMRSKSAEKKNVRKSATTSPTTKLWQIKMFYAPVNATHT